MKKSNFVSMLCFQLLTVSVAQAGAPVIFGTVAAVGPAGEVLSYEKDEGVVTIRRCMKNTLLKEISRDEGCELTAGAVELKLSAKDFKTAALEKLATISLAALDGEDKKDLETSFQSIPSYEGDREKLAERKERLKKYKAFKKENPNDADLEEGELLEKEVADLENKLAIEGKVTAAKLRISKIIDGLLKQMDSGAKLKVLRNSSEGATLAYQVLRAVTEITPCSPELTARLTSKSERDRYDRYWTYPDPELCIAKTATGSGLWKVGNLVHHFEGQGYSGSTMDISAIDLTSGIGLIKVGGLIESDLGPDAEKDIEAQCNYKNMSTPSGYTWGLYGKHGFPETPSDFERLIADGFNELAFNTKFDFWTNSIYMRSNGIKTRILYSAERKSLITVSEWKRRTLQVVCIKKEEK